MRATPKSGLYKIRPTLGDMLTETPALLETMVISGVGDDTKNNVIAVIKAELLELDTICQSSADLAAYLPYWSLSHALSWSRVYDALSAEYDPISNYNMTEEETPAETTETETPAETTKTFTPAETTETETPAETTKTFTPAETTETETPAETTRTVTPAETTDTQRPAEVTDTGDRKDGIFGFDGGSTTPCPADTSEGKTVRTVQTAGTSVLTTQTPGSESLDVDTAGSRALTVDTAGSESLDVDTAGSRALTVDTAGSESLDVDAAGSRVLTVQTPRSLTRSGNIGVTTSQQMIESEAELRARWNMVQIIVADFRREICVGVW